MIQLLLAIIYLAFISLGLPDGLLGSAWPSMYVQFQVPVSYSGIIYMIICGGTVCSSLLSDRLNRKFGTGLVTVLSVATTAVALGGFSFSSSYWMLCLWAIPYGLGAGGVDAALNNYVACHYESRHMSWLHCMWGLGATVGPYIMEYALTGGGSWNMGYRYVMFIQIGLVAVLFFSQPLWKKKAAQNHLKPMHDSQEEDQRQILQEEKDASCLSIDNRNQCESEKTKPLSIFHVLSLPGAIQLMIAFFSYEAVEQTAALWASSYLVLHIGLTSEEAAGLAALFFIGITVGRFLCGFITLKFNDTNMIRMGCGIILIGVIILFLPGVACAKIGLIIIGFGCSPVYPCIIHSTPEHFGVDKSQAVMGVQMASASLGCISMPPLFGLIANHISVRLLPVYLLLFLILMFVMHEIVVKRCQGVFR